MRQLLLHGPAIEASRRKLQEVKFKFHTDNVIVFEKGEDSKRILATLQSVPMFDGERLVIVENPSDDLQSLTCNASSLMLILWFDHTVDVKEWPGFENLFFPEKREVSVFPFLDYLVAKDIKAFVEMEKLKSNGFDIHYFLTMTFYLLRNLAATPKNAPDFVKQKLIKQRVGFSMERITDLYKEMLEIDFKIKMGLLEKTQAEFLLISKFLWGVKDA